MAKCGKGPYRRFWRRPFDVSVLLGVAVCLAWLAGCNSTSEPGASAIVAVVEDVYTRLGTPPTVYVGSTDSPISDWQEARGTLGSALAAKFVASSDRGTGDPGASVALGRFRVGIDGNVRVVAIYVNEDGGDRGCREYVLHEAQPGGWSIVDAPDVWPNCPISTQGEESYHDVLLRARSSACSQAWSVGTCGEWLLLREMHFAATDYYFDTLTGLMIAHRQYSDIGDQPDYFLFGNVNCEPSITKAVPCEHDVDMFEDDCAVNEDCPAGQCPHGPSFMRYSCSEYGQCHELVYLVDPCAAPKH